MLDDLTPPWDAAPLLDTVKGGQRDGGAMDR